MESMSTEHILARIQHEIATQASLCRAHGWTAVRPSLAKLHFGADGTQITATIVLEQTAHDETVAPSPANLLAQSYSKLIESVGAPAGTDVFVFLNAQKAELAAVHEDLGAARAEIQALEEKLAEVRGVLEEAIERTPDPARSTVQLAREVGEAKARAESRKLTARFPNAARVIMPERPFPPLPRSAPSLESMNLSVDDVNAYGRGDDRRPHDASKGTAYCQEHDAVFLISEGCTAGPHESAYAHLPPNMQPTPLAAMGLAPVDAAAVQERMLLAKYRRAFARTMERLADLLASRLSKRESARDDSPEAVLAMIEQHFGRLASLEATLLTPQERACILKPIEEYRALRSAAGKPTSIVDGAIQKLKGGV
jgi:hypothetical protein